MSLTNFFKGLFGKVHVERKKDEISITKHPLFGKLISATYNIHTGSLKVFEFTLSSGGISYFDDDYDGKVEKIMINFEEYTRTEYKQAFIKADKKLAEYKKLLDVDGNIEIAIRKRPETKLEDLLN